MVSQDNDMSLDRIYKMPIADVPLPEDMPPQSVPIAADATDEAFLVGEAGFTGWDALPTASIVGSWDAQTGLQEGQSYDNSEPPIVVGTPTHPVTADYAGWVRPLGNEAGRATGLLDSTRWAGHAEPKFLQDAQRYKDTDAPFTLEIFRVYHPGGTPEYPVAGWGWTVRMISDDPERDITARAVGLYSDPECTAYLYTTGAFVWNAVDEYYETYCPPGQVQPTDAQVNFALLLGAAQEGFFNLPEGGGEAGALFWSHNQ